MLEGVDYLSLYGEGTADCNCEQVFCNFTNVIELDEEGKSESTEYAQKGRQTMLQHIADKLVITPAYERLGSAAVLSHQYLISI